MAAAAILSLLFLSILVTRSTSGNSQRHCCKISLIYVNRLPRLCKNSKWQPPSSWILFLLNILAYLHVGRQRNTRAKFRSNMCNNKRVMSNK